MLVFFKDLYLFEQLVVPFLSKTADERLFEILIEGYAAFLAFGNGTTADVPLMVVDGNKLAKVVNTQRVEVAGDGFLPSDFAIAEGLFNGAIGCSVFAPRYIGTFAVVDQGSTWLLGIVEGRYAFFLHYGYAFGSHIGFYLRENLLENGNLLFKKGSSAVALYAAFSFTLGKVTTEASVDDIV